MSKRKFATDIHQDTYKCIAISTIHLSQEDQERMSIERGEIGHSDMIMERDCGWFMKLYEEPEYVREQCLHFSEELTEIIHACHEAGFRLIEFDRDADELLEYV